MNSTPVPLSPEAPAAPAKDGNEDVAVSPAWTRIPRSVLEKIAEEAKARMKFTATNSVSHMAVMSLDRRICVPGDEIEVFSWLNFKGWTEIEVRSSTVRGGKTCIPFGWVMEMGAPADLACHMPFPPHTWEEILENHPSAPHPAHP